MAIDTGDILKATARLAWDGASDIMNTFHVEITDALANSALQIINDVVLYIDTIYDNWAGSVPTNTDFVDINLFNVTKDEPLGSFDWTTLTTGSGVGDPYAPGVAVFCWLPTSISESFGRKWIGPFQESNINSGIIVPGLGSLIAAGLDFLISPFTAAFGNDTEMQYVVEHKFEDTIELFPPQYNTPTGYNIASNVGYQRRRRPGIGS